MRRGFPCNEYPLSNFRRFIAKSLPSSPVLYKRTASLTSFPVFGFLFVSASSQKKKTVTGPAAVSDCRNVSFQSCLQSTNTILRCIIAGVAEKKSSFPFRVCSYPRVVHLAIRAPSSCMVSTQRPVRGLVVALVRGTTLMTASSTFGKLLQVYPSRFSSRF